MDDYSSKITDKSNDSSSPLLVRITVVDPYLEEEVKGRSQLNDEIDNEVRSDFSNVEIPKHEFDKGVQDIECTKSELKVKQYIATMIPAYGHKDHNI